MSIELTTQYLTPDQVYAYHQQYPEIIPIFYERLRSIIFAFADVGPYQAARYVSDNLTVKSRIQYASEALTEIAEVETADQLAQQLTLMTTELSTGHAYPALYRYIWTIIDTLE